MSTEAHTAHDTTQAVSAETAKVVRRVLPPAVLVATFVALVVFAFLSVDLSLRPEGSVVADDQTISNYLMRHPDLALLNFWLAITLLGNGVPIVVLTAAADAFLALRRRFTLAVALLLTAATGQAMNEILKAIFRRGRPVWTPAFVHPAGYSFPSGHAMGSMIIYGFMIYAVMSMPELGRWRYLISAALAGLIALIAASRVVLGAHWLTDVVGGLAAGLVWLVLCIYVTSWLREHRPWRRFYRRRAPA